MMRAEIVAPFRQMMVVAQTAGVQLVAELYVPWQKAARAVKKLQRTVALTGGVQQVAVLLLLR